MIYKVLAYMVIAGSVLAMVKLWRVFGKYRIPNPFHLIAYLIFVQCMAMMLTQIWSLTLYQIGEWFHKLPAITMTIISLLYPNLCKKYKYK